MVHGLVRAETNFAFTLETEINFRNLKAAQDSRNRDANSRRPPDNFDVDLTDFLLERIAEDEAIASYALQQGIDTHTAIGLLADFDADRRIVALHQPHSAPWTATARIGVCQKCGQRSPCPTLLDLAGSYADHPQFDNGWLPA